ncbi:MAG: YcxB family protein [Armatimonadetes bacterium]|nr:YcxB family protein [Armatimonadota bacterium]
MDELSSAERQEPVVGMRQEQPPATVELDFTLTEGDVAAAFRLYYRHKGYAAVFGLMSVGFALLFALSGQIGMAVTTAAALGLFNLFFWHASTHSHPRRYFRAEPLLQAAQHLEADEIGLSVDSALWASQVKWPVFRAAWQDDRVFLLFSQRMQFHIIPKRAFQSEEELQRFEELLTHHVPCSWVPRGRATRD